MQLKLKSITLKLSDRDRSDMEKLAEIWQITYAETLRRALRETLKREEKEQ